MLFLQVNHCEVLGVKRQKNWKEILLSLHCCHWWIQGSASYASPSSRSNVFQFHSVFLGKMAKILGQRSPLCGLPPSLLVWEVLDPSLVLFVLFRGCWFSFAVWVLDRKWLWCLCLVTTFRDSTCYGPDRCVIIALSLIDFVSFWVIKVINHN